jgi:peptidoglycan/LPS O-acetylase OafA/YrhL
VTLCAPTVATLLPDTPLLPWEPTPAIQFWFLYVFPVTRMLEFVLGILLARIVMSGRWINVPVWAAWVALAIGCVAASRLPSLYRVVAVTIIPLGLLIPALGAAEVRGHRSYMSGRVMVWLGNISFAFYLIHGMVLDMVLQGVQYALGEGFKWTALSIIGGVTLGLAASVLLSWLMFELVEKPMQRRFSVSRRPAQRR